MSIINKSILIIGGTGYIGSSLYLFLKDKVRDIQTLDLEIYGNYVNPCNIKQSVFSPWLRSFISKYDVIIYLAGSSSVPLCIKYPDMAWDNHVIALKEINQCLTDNKLFIYASTSSVYNSNGEMQTENTNIFNVTNMYDFSKYTGDNFIKFFHKCPYFALRFGTVCGVSKNMRNDLMINKMVLDGLKNKSIKISNPLIHRPILAMNDLLRSVETILLNGDDTNYGVYNLASFNSTVKEIATTVSSILEVDLVNDGNTQTYDFTISTSKFENTFNFKFIETIKDITLDIKNSSNIENLYFSNIESRK